MLGTGLLAVVFTLVAAQAVQAAEAVDYVSPELLSRIAIGSCADHRKPQPIWDAILADNPQLFLFLGDNVYADTTDRQRLAQAYQTLGRQPGFAKLRADCPILATWDDHDYGVNDGGAEHPTKAAAQQEFLDFFGVPSDSPRRNREGVYNDALIGPSGKQVQIILLDTRYHRSPLIKRQLGGAGVYVPNKDPRATMLGEAQWNWLESRLRIPAQLRLIGSSIQVLPDEHPFEKWDNLPLERKRLFELLRRLGVDGVILLSGDQHMGELSRDETLLNYPVYEMTSSGMTHTRGRIPARNGKRLGKPLIAHNFGTITIDWGQADPSVELDIRGETGNVELRQSLRLSELRTGKP